MFTKIITIVFLIFSTICFSQKKEDIINFKNINLKLLDSLVFENAMKERAKENLPRMLHDEICAKAALYQSEYMSHYNIISHTNYKSFRGVTLNRLGDRFRYFLGTKKPKKNYETRIEILTQYKNVSTLDYYGVGEKTYQNFARSIIEGFMSSPPHKAGLLYDMSEHGDMAGEYKTFYNPITDCLSVTGLFCLIYDPGRWTRNHKDSIKTEY